VTVARIAAVIVLTLFWPAAQLLVFLLRFGQPPPGGPAESLVFVPMGLVTGITAVLLWERASSSPRRRLVVVGYVAATPFAFIGSLVGGLVLPGVWGPLVFGGAPLIAGCYIGYATGRPRSGDGRTGAST
jgi:hypothetical protein